ncbi:hypothetical protein VIBNISFn27_250005 [Vibrio nigripulchritudo SFn27]|uniref:Uncharacterized protein n=1 Tax=Vibrio nigripulchritudo TaxID=28173 RepID=U4K4Z9_9VIBR|nr:hypothetical protein [Vibrio nigripulchritudo]CCN80769.1 hypothetical protein VIBNIBLFn1_1100005 [Vibrio nigripulchritudo BLFn1]CCN88169.1 hypothetical protein VIBNISFn27_250005 [Vibrio nigripulchritudo SFn27]CCN93670.1 hypothetical protein VIBNIENn2_280003 [Vibrio nigripulchritudo ENn2]CCO43543.1 hypothetical protein VIBNISFn135_970003 [Vibrio nigripulchritudo SFn135]CCO53362.1 hypothetical protein VIBNIWn13_480005 [Vibrio nigripulchritudo Wn13]
MKLSTQYILDREAIKLNAYRLLSHFYANKEISRQVDPEDRDDAIARLEDDYFYREISRLLLEIAIALRVLDDQMKKYEVTSDIRRSYDSSVTKVNHQHNCMMFDKMSLREVCNKIIHADTVEPHMGESEDGSHRFDDYNWLGWSEAIEQTGDKTIPQPALIKWTHLTNNIRLGGKKGNTEWWHLLEVPIFVRAISELLE